MKSVYVSTNLVGELDDNLDEKDREVEDLSGEIFVKCCVEGRDTWGFVSTINVVVLYVGFCITNFVLCQYLHVMFVRLCA